MLLDVETMKDSIKSRPNQWDAGMPVGMLVLVLLVLLMGRDAKTPQRLTILSNPEMRRRCCTTTKLGNRRRTPDGAVGQKSTVKWRRTSKGCAANS